MIKLPSHLARIRNEKILLRFPSAQSCGYVILQCASAAKAAARIPVTESQFPDVRSGLRDTKSAALTEFETIFTKDAEDLPCIHLKIQDALEWVTPIEHIGLAGGEGVPMMGYSGAEVKAAAAELLQSFETLIAATVPTEPTARLRWPDGVSRLSRETISIRFERHQESAYFLLLEARIGKLAESVVALDSFVSERLDGKDTYARSQAFFRFEHSTSVDAAGHRCVALRVPEALELSRDLDRALTLLEGGVRPLAYRRPITESLALAPDIGILESVLKAKQYLETHTLSNDEFQAAIRATSKQIGEAITSVERVRGAEPVVLREPAIEPETGVGDPFGPVVETLGQTSAPVAGAPRSVLEHLEDPSPGYVA